MVVMGKVGYFRCLILSKAIKLAHIYKKKNDDDDFKFVSTNDVMNIYSKNCTGGIRSY